MNNSMWKNHEKSSCVDDVPSSFLLFQIPIVRGWIVPSARRIEKIGRFPARVALRSPIDDLQVWAWALRIAAPAMAPLHARAPFARRRLGAWDDPS